MTEPLLHLEGVSKRYKGFHLDRAGFSLPGGMMMGLIGANGSGKTTLIKLILGLIQPEGGSLRFKGRDLRAEGPELRRRIAYVRDEPRFVPELRLAAIKDCYAPFYPDFDEAKWTQLMAEYELDPRQKAGQLSLGMRTKFALTLALSRSAELLVLDEPTTGLDPAFRRRLLQQLSGLIQDESRSILFSTHITSDLEARADWVTLLQDGHMVFSQTQDQVREDWGLVKGGLELLDDEAKSGFRGLRTNAHGFEALVADRDAAQHRFQGRALVERASLEDILVLLGRRSFHAA